MNEISKKAMYGKLEINPKRRSGAILKRRISKLTSFLVLVKVTKSPLVGIDSVKCSDLFIFKTTLHTVINPTIF